MESLLQFLRTIRELRTIKRQGVLYYGVKPEDVDSASDHTFRLTLMIWLLGQGKKLNLAKAMKLALVHDLCKVYTGDITPYQGLFSKKDIKHQLAWRWRRLSLQEKKKRYTEKFQKEKAAIRKLTAKLSPGVKREILAAWDDYQKMESPEAQFMLQVDRIENLLEAFEQFEKDSKFPTQPWWEHADEVIADKDLHAFLEAISRKEISMLQGKKQRKRRKG
ncbi:MAG: HD domain-containing protein [bacterium]|nr:HD domain-containing protein [bacterium]